MPMYEYSCQACGCRFEELVRDSNQTAPPCPECESKKTTRLLSCACLRGARKDTGAGFSKGGGGKCGGCPGGSCSSCG